MPTVAELMAQKRTATLVPQSDITDVTRLMAEKKAASMQTAAQLMQSKRNISPFVEPSFGQEEQTYDAYAAPYTPPIQPKPVNEYGVEFDPALKQDSRITPQKPAPQIDILTGKAREDYIPSELTQMPNVPHEEYYLNELKKDYPGVPEDELRKLVGKGPIGYWQGVGRGLKRAAEDVYTLPHSVAAYFIAKKLEKNDNITDEDKTQFESIYNKFENGEEISEGEREIARGVLEKIKTLDESLLPEEKGYLEYFQNRLMQRGAEDRLGTGSILGEGGLITGQSLPYAAEMIVTQGSSTAVRETVKGALTKGLGKLGKNVLTKFGINTTSFVTAQAARSLLMPSLYSDIGDRAAMGENSPITISLMEKTISNVAEMSGGKLAKIVKKIPLIGIPFRAWEKLNPGGTPKGFFSKLFNASAYHGLPEENLEEEFEKVLRTMTGLDESFKMPTLRDLTTRNIGFAAPGIGRAVLASPLIFKDHIRGEGVEFVAEVLKQSPENMEGWRFLEISDPKDSARVQKKLTKYAQEQGYSIEFKIEEGRLGVRDLISDRQNEIGERTTGELAAKFVPTGELGPVEVPEQTQQQQRQAKKRQRKEDRILNNLERKIENGTASIEEIDLYDRIEEKRIVEDLQAGAMAGHELGQMPQGELLQLANTVATYKANSTEITDESISTSVNSAQEQSNKSGKTLYVVQDSGGRLVTVSNKPRGNNFIQVTPLESTDQIQEPPTPTIQQLPVDSSGQIDTTVEEGQPTPAETVTHKVGDTIETIYGTAKVVAVDETGTPIIEWKNGTRVAWEPMAERLFGGKFVPTVTEKGEIIGESGDVIGKVLEEPAKKSRETKKPKRRPERKFVGPREQGEATPEVNMNQPPPEGVTRRTPENPLQRYRRLMEEDGPIPPTRQRNPGLIPATKRMFAVALRPPPTKTAPEIWAGAATILNDPAQVAELTQRAFDGKIPSTPEEEAAMQIIAEDAALDGFVSGNDEKIEYSISLFAGRGDIRSTEAQILVMGAGRMQMGRAIHKLLINAAVRMPVRRRIALETERKAYTEAVKEGREKDALKSAKAIENILQTDMDEIRDLRKEIISWGVDLRNLDGEIKDDIRVAYRIMREINMTRSSTGMWDAYIELLRNNLMSAPATPIRNAMSGFYAIGDLIVKTALEIPARVGLSKVSKAKSIADSTLKEAPAMWQAFFSKVTWKRAIQNAAYSYWYEVPAFEIQTANLQDSKNVWMYSNQALNGKAFGKLMSYPFGVQGKLKGTKIGRLFGTLYRKGGTAPTAFGDQLIKTVYAHAVVAEAATRNAKAKGMTFDEEHTYKDYMDNELEDLGSESWQRALREQEMYKISFQLPSSGLEKQVLKLRDAEILGMKPTTLLIMFAKTPIQITARGIENSVFGMPLMGVKGMEKLITGKKYTAQQAIRDFTNSMAGIAATAMLWPLVRDMKITPTRDYRPVRKSAEGTNRQITPRGSFYLFGGWHSYENAGPWSVTLGIGVNFVQGLFDLSKLLDVDTSEMTPAQKDELKDKIDDLGAQFTSRTAGLISNQTFVKGLGDAYKSILDWATYGDKLKTNFFRMHVPNLFGSAFKATDRKIRNSRTDKTESWFENYKRRTRYDLGFAEVGTMMPIPDILGEDLERPGDTETGMFMRAMFNPVRLQKDMKGTSKGWNAVWMLSKWNHNHPNNQKHFSDMGRTVTAEDREDDLVPPAIQLTKEEIYDMHRLAGKLFDLEIHKKYYKFNIDNPGVKDVALLENMRKAATSEASDRMTGIKRLENQGKISRSDRLRVLMAKRMASVEAKLEIEKQKPFK